MAKQRELFPEAPQVIVRCPECRYTADAARRSNFHVPDDDTPLTVYAQHFFFEVGGCDDGEIMCPRCAAQFAWPPVGTNHGDTECIEKR